MAVDIVVNEDQSYELCTMRLQFELWQNYGAVQERRTQTSRKYTSNIPGVLSERFSTDHSKCE